MEGDQEIVVQAQDIYQEERVKGEGDLCVVGPHSHLCLHASDLKLGQGATLGLQSQKQIEHHEVRHQEFRGHLSTQVGLPF